MVPRILTLNSSTSHLSNISSSLIAYVDHFGWFAGDPHQFGGFAPSTIQIEGRHGGS